MKIAIIESTILNIIDRITIKRLATRENIVIQAGNNNTILIKPSSRGINLHTSFVCFFPILCSSKIWSTMILISPNCDTASSSLKPSSIRSSIISSKKLSVLYISFGDKYGFNLFPKRAQNCVLSMFFIS